MTKRIFEIVLSTAVFISLSGACGGDTGAAQINTADTAASVSDTALSSARAELEAAPTHSNYSRLGYLLLKKGMLDKAMEAFNKALELRPDYHAAKTGKGTVLLEKGDLPAAERLLREALVLNPDPVKTYYELGRLYEKMGDFGKALAEYKEGIRKFEQGRR